MLNYLKFPPANSGTGAASRRHPRLMLLMATVLASLAFLAVGPAARASAAPTSAATAQGTAWCDQDRNGSAVLASEVEFNGTMYANARGFLASPLEIAGSSGSSGWHTSLLSFYGNYLLTMQDDGNLVMHRIQWTGYISCGGGPYYFTYHDLGVAWATDAGFARGTGPVTARIQNDGNLVVYYGSLALWASDSSGSPYTTAYRLVVQDDGNLVVYLGSQVIWDRYDGSHR